MLSRKLRVRLTSASLSLLLLGAQSLQACSSDDDDSPASSAGKSGSAGLGDAGAETGGSAGKAASGGSNSGGVGAGDTPSGGADGVPPEQGAAGSDAEPELGTGGSGNDQPALCAQFCDDEASICTDDLQQYTDQANCLAECSGWSRGLEGDTTGNTLDCRIYHLAAAAGSAPDAAVTHCPHTGAHPQLFCLD
jgi:hypothetical protein